MKIIDIYIIKKFLSTFLFILAVIMLVAIIFDISEQIDEFLKSDAPFFVIVTDYYINFVLYYGNLFSALLIFIAVIWFTSVMAGKTEIVAILSSGMSFRRMLLPYFIAATLLAAVSFYFNHSLIPKANKVRLDFENTYFRSPYRLRANNIHKQVKPGEFIFFERYNSERDIGYKFTYETWEGTRLVSKLMAAIIKWDSLSGKWQINDYMIRDIDGLNETMRRGSDKDTTLGFTPHDFARRMVDVEMMDYAQLEAFIEDESFKGSDEIPFYEIEKHQRSSYPFATYVLTLIGVSIASRKVKGGIGMHIAIGMLICVSYILAMKVTTVYATNAGLDPLIAVWLPNVIFGIFALFLLKFAPK